MATADELTSEAYPGKVRRSRSRHIRRAVICTGLGLIEGLAAAALSFGVALAYHLAVLRMAPEAFPYAFYGAFSGLAGVGHGGFAALAAARFLDGRRRVQTILLDCFYGWTAAIAVTLFTAFLAGSVGDLSRVSLTAAYLLGAPVLMFVRSRLLGTLETQISSGRLQFERVVVIGTRADVAGFLAIGHLGRAGYLLGGTLGIEDASDPAGKPSLPAVAEFVRMGLRRGIDHVVLVGDLGGPGVVESIVAEVQQFALSVVYAPAVGGSSLRYVDVVPLGPSNALRFSRKPLSNADVLLKRGMDLVLSAAGLVVLTPLLTAVALAIALETPGPVLYRQARRGFNGEPFLILKFRTMSVIESGYAMRQAEAGDARVTRVGRLLRRTSIDELPQLWNVLLGHMSLVGPRPHAISHDDELSLRVANYALRQRIKPGITGWAQVNGFRGETRTAEQIEGRVRHDTYYIENWSIFLDLWTLVLTVVSPAARRNAR